MKYIFKKYVKSLICIALCLAMLSSCGIIAFNSPTDDNISTDTAEPPETKEPYQVSEYEKYTSNYSKEIESFLKDVDDFDYNGGTFLIANTKAAQIVPDETTSAILAKEFEARNKFVEEQLNIVLAERIVLPDALYDEIRQAIKSSTYYADLIMITQSKIGEYASEGLLVNLASLPSMNFEAGYYNSSSVSASGANSQIYAIAGHASISYDSLSAVYYNKDLLNKITDENLNKLVDEGKWTWDKFLEYANKVSSLEGEYYSIGAQNTSLYLQDLIFISSGLQYVDSKHDAMPQIGFTAKTADPVVEIIKKIMNHERKYTNDLDAITAFSKGSTLFLIDKLSTMKTIAGSSADWGVVPLPKFSEAQKNYRTLAFYDDAKFFAVVPTVSDTQKISTVLAMLNISSYGETPDAYAANAMSYYLRDNKSTKNVETIMKSAVYDLSYSFTSEAKAISTATYINIRNSSTDFYTVKSYLGSWTKAFNNAMNKLFGEQN